MKISISLAVTLAGMIFCSGISFAQEAVETIFYDIKPVGSCVYKDFGITEFRGNKAKLTIFETNVAGFKDKEVILSEVETGLPILVQRDIHILMHNEKITEEYFPRQNSFKLTKIEGGKKTEEYYVQGKGPIQNAILVPFSLRQDPELKIGKVINIILPAEYKVEVVSIEDVTVPAGKFRAYHLTSKPNKFEIWISADSLRVPVKIKGLSGFPYTLEMKKRVAK